MATGYPATVPGKEAALPRQGTANARGDEQEPSQAGLVGRACTTRQSPLSILSQTRKPGARVRKDACSPREICRDVHQRTDRTVRGAITWQKSAEDIVVGGNEPRWNRRGWSHPDEGPNGAQPNGLGKWSWLSKSMFLPT